MKTNQHKPLLEPSGHGDRTRVSVHSHEYSSMGGVDNSLAKSMDHTQTYHRMKTFDVDDSLTIFEIEDSCHCDLSFICTLFSFIIGVIIIFIAFIFHENNYFNINGSIEENYVILTTSYVILLISFSTPFILSSIWCILQYYPLNGCLNCIKHTSGINIFCTILAILLLILSVIGLFDEYSDLYDHHNMIVYPWWLSLTLLFVSIICIIFVSCINTKSAKLKTQNRIGLQNFYFNKMISEEGNESDFKRKEHITKIPEYIQQNTPLHPYDRSLTALIWHTLTHWHIFSLIHLGSQRTLQSYHCYYPPKGDDIEYNFNKWCEQKQKQEKKHGKGNISTWSILWGIEGKSFCILTGIMMISILPSLAVPQLIGELAYFYEHMDVELSYGIWLSIFLLLIGIIRIEFGAIVMTMASRVCGRIISLLSYVIYHKAIHMSVNTDDELSMGQKITLLAADTRMVAYALAYEPMFLAQIILLILVCVFLHIEIGISALGGWMFVLIISLPIQSIVGGKVMSAWKKYIALSDTRVKFIDELIKGIRVTKMYAWERPLMNEILNYRQQEMVQLLKRIKFISLMSMINNATPSIMALMMFGTYIALGNALTLRVVFAVITLIQMLGMAVRILPYAVMLGVGGAVAIKRLTKFYNAKDQMDMILPKQHNMDEKDNDNDNDNDSNQYVVYMKDASFKWPKLKKKKVKKRPAGYTPSSYSYSYSQTTKNLTSSDEKEQKYMVDYEFLLDRICMKLEKGKLYALVGSVGSGKSSLIYGILREMEQINGVLKVNGCEGKNTNETIGYCSQNAFIINDTVRANILWGLPYQKHFYETCLRASSLIHDLNILANGDLTEIGERGINLSGGQKQRISFCRALYRRKQTNLYLLDDPLSAVDTHVGNNLFNKGIKEVLKNKTILLVMNSHLHLLEYMDEIIIMDKGKLVVQTDYDSVMENEQYAHLLPGDDKSVSRSMSRSLATQLQYENEELKTNDNTSKMGRISELEREKKGKLTTKEDRKTGMVAWSTYFQYFSNAVNPFNHNEVVNDELPYHSHIGSKLLFLFEICLLIFGQICLTGSDIWLAFWAEEQQVNRFPGLSDSLWLIIWSIFIALLTIVTFCSSYLFGYLSNKAAQSVHMKTLYCILRAPMSYFNKTPTGRILNRFSKDTNEMDAELPSGFVNFSLHSLTVCGYIIVIIISIPFALILLLLLLPMLYYLQKYFRMSSSDIKRLVQVSTTPIISQFSETLGGLDTIRAYKTTERIFLKDIRQKIRLNHKITLTEQLSTRWFGQYMDFMIVIFLLCQTLLCCFLREYFDTALLALSIVYGFSMMGMLQWAIRSSIEVEKNFTTIERLLYYENALKKNAEKRKNKLHTDFEEKKDDNDSDNDNEENNDITAEFMEINYNYRPNKWWPYNGKIKINNLKMRYRKDLDLVLNGLSVEILPGEKVGIVGRTGAGKSSLLLALFRLVEPTHDSLIEIDDVNCLNLGLKDLRSSLSIIPQEPVLFSGTLKFNLDPFNEKSENEIWDVLRKCELYNFINSKDEKLNFGVTEGGNNFSAGQKQLICIGRALLKKSKVLCLDEATSSIDKHTDSLIQTLIRKEFSGVTVLCIAHRLDTIVDYDKIMVLSKGNVVEYDTPDNLLNDENGQFYEMINGSQSNLENIKM